MGIVTRSDVLTVYNKPDAQIRDEVASDLAGGALPADPGALTVIVKDGIVTLAGTPQTSAAGHDMVDAVRHMEGVVAVRDRLSYPPDERP